MSRPAGRPNSPGVAERSQQPSRTTGGFASKLEPYVQRSTESGALSALAGGTMLARAGRAFLQGDRRRALVRAAAGTLWLAVAVTQRRTGRQARPRGESGAVGVDQQEVEDTSRGDESAATDAGAAETPTERGGPPTTGESDGTSTGAGRGDVSERSRDEEGETDAEPGGTLGGGTVATEEEAVELEGVDDESGTDERGTEEDGTDESTSDASSTDEDAERGSE